MSLDVYLTLPGQPHALEGSTSDGIFIRRDGATVQISMEEWDELYPGRDPVIFLGDDDSDEVYSSNCTHNLTDMAREVDLYQPLWHPEELGITKASELVEPLTKGLVRLWNEEERLLAFNPKNGWGNYEGLLAFVKDYLVACETHPDAEVHTSI